MNARRRSEVQGIKDPEDASDGEDAADFPVLFLAQHLSLNH
jgi:hypothetical protein